MLSIKARELRLSSKITKLTERLGKNHPTKVRSPLKLAGMRVNLLMARPMVTVLLSIPLANLKVISMSVK